MLAVKDVVKTFGPKRAVDGVSLEVMPGDIFGFVGHNGAGKTTLIRAI
ncbi:MAG: ATP-binding cassette domain-containing protein, partial [Clostridiales bacterium]|nr:ATP-binding cassette domain-containing protein [Clostridiales bacterium]